MKYTFGTRKLTFALLALCVIVSCAQGKSSDSLRAPAWPLINIDPFTNAWSRVDRLYDAPTMHWTGKVCPLIGIVNVDGTDYRFMGVDGKFSHVQMSEWEDCEGGMQKTFSLSSFEGRPLFLRFSCKDNYRLYLNDTQIFDLPHNHYGMPVELYLSDEMRALLVDGENTLRFECYRSRDSHELQLDLYQWHPATMQTAEQTSVSATATQTRYSFVCGPVDLDLKFTAPLLMDDLELISRPVNYVSYDVKSNDGRKHAVSVSIKAQPAFWTVNALSQETTAEVVPFGDLPENSPAGMVVVRMGRTDQQPLRDCGDNCTIEWGWFYLASAYSEGQSACRADVVQPAGKDIMFKTDFNPARKLSGHFMVAYDDIRSVRYFGKDLRPYWNRDSSKTVLDEISVAEKEYKDLLKRCDSFDRKLRTDAEKAGGSKYADLCELAYRQCIGAHKLVELPSGDIAFFSKECDSNGSIGTVDVTYPSAPLFLKYNPKLCEGLLNFIFEFSESDAWPYPSAPHDVGCYPWAEGQGYPVEMFVEESGNMLLLTAAICKAEGDWNYAAKHWETLSTWKDYLLEHGLDPENQLCTDDFAGHLAHNANLSVKAILGIAAYAQMADALGHSDAAAELTKTARDMASRWVEMADADDHFGLTFDRHDSWSQKYNLVWDNKLGLGIFPPEVSRKELAYYHQVSGPYGIPLDSRSKYTKSDWITWSAAMAESKAEFESFIAPLWDYYNETPARVPMTDWYFTDVPYYCMFIARSVVGGYFMRMLSL